MKIVSSSPSKTCLLDPIPTSLLKQCVDKLMPILTVIINLSLTTGTVPQSLKNAVVSPILKKSSLDSNIFKNYRPVSNLPFLSKVIEKVVASQLITYLGTNSLLEPLQSAYKKHHSTETALLKVHNDICTALDRGQCVLLILLDLSAAFDTIDHDILITRLSKLGITGITLQWFSSYLKNRTQSLARWNQQFKKSKPDETNKLQLNDSKTEVLFIRSQFNRLPRPIDHINIGSSCIQLAKSARNIGVTFDDQHSLQHHIALTCRSIYHHLRTIGRIRHYLTDEACKMLVHALITTKLDYCNSLLYGLPAKDILPLQHAQNTAARMVSRTRKFNHITPVLINLHWLQVVFRIQYKTLLITYKALHDSTPIYIRLNPP
ncbi:uncharacterized protein [Ptychodera flava]|uniref:uncharacterized protein n=1 Tax=Ptychodera flava TaxID=63121 RepID=UPI00396A1268